MREVYNKIIKINSYKDLDYTNIEFRRCIFLVDFISISSFYDCKFDFCEWKFIKKNDITFPEFFNCNSDNSNLLLFKSRLYDSISIIDNTDDTPYFQYGCETRSLSFWNKKKNREILLKKHIKKVKHRITVRSHLESMLKIVNVEAKYA